ncbi:MAG TPA: DUF2203 domain-containing protein [Candidatus Limnocylindrales bacterium]|nr:DUF2203 domain-containing protein [Candidatus Limnocylindrales bacterium]
MARFYGIDEANQRLDAVRPLLEQLRADRASVAQAQRELVRARTTNGSAEHAEELARLEADVRAVVQRMQQAVARLDAWGIALRDIATGLIDFPALANGRPIWLCWRLGEADVGWWHEQSAGFDSRRPLAELS